MIRILRLAVLVLALAPLAACETNPATGRPAFTAFMSPAEEVEIGRREHPKVLRQFNGAYREGPMDDYARAIGARLAALSEMPGLAFHFTVLNDDMVNAMALPGGYVYISRGLLALAENEAEMAGVLAHEIGHVAARHTAQRYSQQIATGLGLAVLGAIGSAAGVPANVGDLASFGAQAYLQSFTREQELEADTLAVRYMRRAGYDPWAMVTMFRKLEAQDRLEAALRGQPSAAERYNIMSTHPRTSERIAQAIGLANVAAAGEAITAREDYLARLDGMIYGDDPKEGVRHGRTFSHPGIGIQFTVPPGYALFNGPSQVYARGPHKALIVFDMEDRRKARQVQSLRSYLVFDWAKTVSLVGVQRLDVNGMEGATGTGRVQTRDGAYDLRLVAIRDGPERLFRLRFLTRPADTARAAADLQRTTYSFRRLTPEEATAIRPLRLRVVTVQPGDTAQSLAERMPFDNHRLDRFEAINGLERGQALVPGSKVKVVGD